ncbi:MAG: DUF1987 domain-containing protein [Bacteroidales bacterium]|nr:DUF1987 domain-containing protein [Bacteroidales bacterium]
MEVLLYESKDLLPGILLDKQSGTFQITGHSCPEDASEFFEPVFSWFDKYKENPLKSTTLEFKMAYFNTVSAKVFYLIMSKMEDLSFSGHDVKIRWFYPEGDEDLEEAGQEFENILDLEFECISVTNEDEEDNIEDYFDDID